MVQLKHYADKRIKSYRPAMRAKGNWRHELLRRQLAKDGKLLDIGCANGHISRFVKDKENYCGIDYNPDLVDFCRSNGLHAERCDLTKEKIPFDDECFDVVFMSHVLEHLDSREQQRALAEVSRVLKKGGTLLLFAPTPYHWYFWDDHTHIRPCTHGQLEHLAKDSGFRHATAKYSLMRRFPANLQSYLRLPPMRFFLWEVFMIAKK